MEKLVEETGTGQRKRERPESARVTSKHQQPGKDPRKSPERKCRNTRNNSTSKCTAKRSEEKSSASTLVHSVRKTIQKSSPQRNRTSHRTSSTTKTADNKSTSVAKPLSKFRIPKVKSTDQHQSQPKEQTSSNESNGNTRASNKNRKSEDKATVERKSSLSSCSTSESMEATREQRRYPSKNFSYSNNVSNKDILNRKVKSAEKSVIQKKLDSKRETVTMRVTESTHGFKKSRLTTTFPLIKENQFASRMPVPFESSGGGSDREIARKMFAPIRQKVEALSHTPDFIVDENMDMDWDNQVPEIRRLWDEISVLPCTENNDDDMEVDPTDILILVPDTNIWIGCVNLLKQLLNTDFPTVGYPTIVIPWMVLQELDVKSKAPDSKSARHSVKFIHDLLSSKHPRIRGQKASDAALSQMKFDDIVADDSILQCAFQLQRSDSTVVFLSNDRNLCNKALVHGLITFDSQDTVLKITKMLTREDSSLPVNINYTATPSYTNGSLHDINSYANAKYNSSSLNSQPNQLFSAPSTNVNPHYAGTIQSATTESINSNLNERNFVTDSVTDVVAFNEVLDKLKTTISYIIETKMKEDYGDTWNHTVKIKPPWSLLSGVKCMVLHWIAVFSFVFGSKGQSCAEELYDVIKKYENSARNHQMETDIVECAIGLFTLGKSSPIMQCPQVMNCRQMLMNFVALKK